MLFPQSLLTMTVTGTGDSAGAGVGAADEAEGEPVPSSSTTVEFWAASGSQHSAAQIAATSGTLAQCVSVASIAQISGLPILVPQLAPVVCSGVGDGAGNDGKVGLGLGDEVAASFCRRCRCRARCRVTEGLEAERSSEERSSSPSKSLLPLEPFLDCDAWLEVE